MNFHNVLVSTFKNIFFAVIVIAVSIPLFLSLPGFSGIAYNLLSLIGIGE